MNDKSYGLVEGDCVQIFGAHGEEKLAGRVVFERLAERAHALREERSPNSAPATRSGDGKAVNASVAANSLV